MDKSFEAIVRQSDRLTFIDIPFNPSEVFKKKGKIEVVGELNGNSFRKSLLSRGNGKYIITLDRAMLKRLGINAGDAVSITIRATDSALYQQKIKM